MDSLNIDSKRWQILSSQYILQNPWLTVRRDHVRQPSGVEIPDYWVLEYPEWINVIAITTSGLFVIERQYRHAIARTDYEIPAGCVEPSESPLEAAKRELLEETGYAGGEWTSLMCVSPNGTSMTNFTHCFLANGVSLVDRPHPESTEDIDVLLFSDVEVRHLLVEGKFVQATMVAPLYKYFSTL